MNDCFGDMKEVQHAGGVVNDQSCDEPKSQSLCPDRIDRNRIVSEVDCQTVGYMLFSIIIIKTHTNISYKSYVDINLFG